MDSLDVFCKYRAQTDIAASWIDIFQGTMAYQEMVKIYTLWNQPSIRLLIQGPQTIK